MLVAALALVPAVPHLAPAIAGDTALSEYLGTGYLAPFVVLLLCGFGLPIPEEITMLGAGLLAYRGDVEFVRVVLVCFVATLLGDSIPYFVGRHFGRRALRSRMVRRAVHPERLRSIERRFARSGLWAVFVCRFLPGVRLPAWFTAGTLGISYPRFIAVDALAAAIMTPAYVALGRFSGETFEDLEGHVGGLTHVLGLVALALALGFLVHLAVAHKPRRGLGGRRVAPEAPVPPTAGPADARPGTPRATSSPTSPPSAPPSAGGPSEPADPR